MRLNNANRAGLFNFLSSFILLFITIAVMIFIGDRFFFHVLGKRCWALLGVALALGFVFYLRGRPYFMYDSDGEALNFKNWHFLPIFFKVANDEFPKYKLIGYDIINFLIFKKLYIKISSKKSNQLILKYDISYLSQKEVNDLKFSLNKVINSNQESKKI